MDEERGHEVQTLRRSLRDVLALSALPAVWSGYSTGQIANNLADVLMRALDCEAIHVTLSGPHEVEAVRLRDGADPELVSRIREGRTGELTVVSYPLSGDERDRLVAAVSRHGFPTDAERLLLRVATNQARTWIERKNAEAALAAESAERKRAERAAAFMAHASEMLSRSLDSEATLQAIGELVVPQLADWCFVDLVEADGSFHRAVVAHADPDAAPIGRRLVRSFAAQPLPLGVSRTVATGEITMMNGVTPETLIAGAQDDDHRDALLAIGIRCVLSVPMTSGGRTVGAITLIGAETRTHFDDRDMALVQELTRRAALAVDNARHYREAQEANRAKDEFLANLSHELRTPMTAILGWAHLLQLGDVDAEQMKLGIDTIRQSGQAQAKLIDELLDVSRIVSGKLHLNPAPLDLCVVVRAAVTAIRPAADAKRQTLLLDLSTEHLATTGDAARLQQVFWNLLSNAVKFTPPGGSIRIALEQPGVEMATISVTDTGEGISPAFLPLVFERFKQAATVIRGRTGLGLGLAIAKDLVELHGGTITAFSGGEKKGSTFTVTLPVQRTAVLPSLPARERIPLQHRRVLLVEDDEATRTLLETILRSYGADVRASASTAEAIVSERDFDPEVLITDIEMPGDDGIALLHHLRASHAALPAIAVTGYADEQNRTRIMGAGFNGFVAKPLDPHVLATEVQRALGSR